jgi:hypothetical protein
MALPYGESSFFTEQIVQENISYPFWNEGDQSCKIYSQRVNVHLDYYRPMPLDTPHRTDPTAMLVAESPPDYIEAKVVESTREFATIPQTRNLGISYNWLIPGIASASAVNWVTPTAYRANVLHRDDTVVEQFYDLKEWTYIPGRKQSILAYEFDLTDASAFSVGEVVTIRAKVYNGYRLRGTKNRTPASVINSQFTIVAKVSNTLYFLSYNMHFASLSLWTGKSPRLTDIAIGVNFSREPRGETVSARMQLDYFHSANPWNSWAPQEPFRIYDTATKTIGGVSVGQHETDILKAGTAPSVSEYMTIMQRGDWLLAEPQKLSRWMGNIWQVESIFVKPR